MPRHRDLVGDDLHVAHALEFSNASARLAASVTPGDIGKLARQLDDGSFWILIDDAPLTWQKFGGGSFSGPAVGQIQGFWVGSTQPPDDSWIWIVTDVPVGGPASVSAVAALFGMSAVPPGVQSVGSPVQIAAAAVAMGLAAVVPTVQVLGGAQQITAAVALVPVALTAPVVSQQSAGGGITYVGAGAAVQTTGTSPGSVSPPAGVQDGDLLLLYVSAGSSVIPAGWTDGVSDVAGVRLLYKRASGVQGAVSVDFDDYGGAGATFWGRMFAFRGVIGTGSPFDGIDAAWSTAAAAVITGAARTTTYNDSMIGFIVHHGAATAGSASGGVDTLVASSSSGPVALGYDSTPTGTAGLQVAPTITFGSSVAVYHATFALRKA